MRARTIRTTDGKTISGAVVVEGLLHRVLHQMTRNRRRDQQADLREGLISAMEVASRPQALLEEFDALETHWSPPEQTGFERAAAQS